MNVISRAYKRIAEAEHELRRLIQQYIDMFEDGEEFPGFYVKNHHLYEGHSVVNLDECNEGILRNIACQLFDIYLLE